MSERHFKRTVRQLTLLLALSGAGVYLLVQLLIVLDLVFGIL